MLPFNARPAGGSVGGILRKTGSSSGSGSAGAVSNANGSSTAAATGETRQVDLLVFGYACKVFRDDAKAREIDQGKHLIPWMGDSNLKIDRYDVRGALYDLAPYEPPPGGYGNRLDYLTAEEQRAELLCEEERYLYLYNNEEEHILQQEEDLKRLKQESGGSAYNQVAFQYDAFTGAVQHGPNREEHTNSPSCEEADQVFQLPKNFQVPAFIQLPEIMKQHAIIEKTARFIASQGVQMEILLKAKQSNNVQFEFLSQNSVLNPYYKYVTNAIKNGTYPAVEEPKEISAEPAVDAVETHAVLAKSVITVPTIKYKPSANCAYTQLISRIKGVPLPSVIDEKSENTTGDASTPSPVNSAADFTPVLLQYNGNTFVSAESEENSNSNSISQLHSNNNNNNTTSIATDGQPQVEILKNSSALALAQDYLSDTESEEEEPAEAIIKPEPVLNFPIPTDNLKNIIDKTATYVIKNGRQFEETLRTKSEDRFTFLIPDSEYYPYYMYKITGDPDAASKEQKTRKAAAVAAALLTKKGLIGDKTVSPVSFCIKSKDEPTTNTLQPVLPQEPSDDEESEQKAATEVTQARTVPEHVQKAIQLVESQLMARNAQLAAAAASGAPLLGNRTAASSTVRSRFDMDYNQTSQMNNAKLLVKNTKAEIERNALFEQQQQHRLKELKKAEEKVKDKLAQIAREKLGGLLSKEKQLQMERKRKAMAFLNQIKGAPSSIDETDSIAEQTEVKAKDEEEVASEDSDASVHSIPITSFGPDEKTDDEEEQRLEPITTATTKLPDVQTIETVSKSPIVLEKEQRKRKPTTVTVSDDDDVQLVGEIKAPTMLQQHSARKSHKRRSDVRQSDKYVSAYKRRRKESSSESSSSSSTSTSEEEEEAPRNVRRSKMRSHKSAKLKKSSSSKSRSSKNKSKKRALRSPSERSKSHKRSRSRYSRSYSEESMESLASEQRQRQRRSKRVSHTPTKSTKKKNKKRRSER